MHVQKYDSLHCIILEWDNMVFCARLFWAAMSFQPQNNKRNIMKMYKFCEIYINQINTDMVQNGYITQSAWYLV